jgi:hypothetical protein
LTIDGTNFTTASALEIDGGKKRFNSITNDGRSKVLVEEKIYVFPNIGGYCDCTEQKAFGCKVEPVGHNHVTTKAVKFENSTKSAVLN